MNNDKKTNSTKDDEGTNLFPDIQEMKATADEYLANNDPFGFILKLMTRYPSSYIAEFASKEHKKAMLSKCLTELGQKEGEIREITAKLDKLEALEKLTYHAPKLEEQFIRLFPFWEVPGIHEQIRIILIQRAAIKAFLRNREVYLSEIKKCRAAQTTLNQDIRAIIAKIIACLPDDTPLCYTIILATVYLSICDENGLADWDEINYHASRHFWRRMSTLN